MTTQDKRAIEESKIDWDYELAIREISHIVPGDMLINRDGELARIEGYQLDSYSKRPCYSCTLIMANGGEYHSTIEFDAVSLVREYTPKWRKLYADVDTVFNDAVANIETYSVDGADETDEIDEDTKALSIASGKAAVDAHKRMLQERENAFEVMEWTMKRKMAVLQQQATIMGRQLKYTKQIVRLMELFLGVYENIVTLREGQPAPASFPINLRQLVLYMDEEVATIQFFNGQRGIDFQSIEEFDKWLLEDPSHVDLVIPEGKGVVAMRPSRQEREYSRNLFINFELGKKNMMMYLLIRNGECLYRVYTDVLVGERLFPSQEEMNELITELEKAPELSRAEEDARSKEMTWRYKAALIQGLIERTTVLHPLPSEGVSLFNPESFDRGDITLIRDAEDINLPDGRLSFGEWREQANQSIGVGSRIIITGAHLYRSRENSGQERYESHAWAWRYGGNYYRWVPSAPDDGVYVVEDAKMMKPYGYYSTERMCFKIMYMPQDRIKDYEMKQSWGDNPPKPRRQSFWVSEGDEFMLNYDAFNLEDIEYYISNRIYRKYYLSVIPQMFNLRDLRLAEIEEEKLLVVNFAARYDVDEADVWDALEWWKRKNKLQRPMREDEAKAWRMIRRRLGIKER